MNSFVLVAGIRKSPAGW